MKNNEDYYLGLDIGTNSVGWAVSDIDYKILKFHGKAMWGFHLFEEGQTASKRRLFRSARRRVQRSVQRLNLLQDFFKEEINKIDPEFFQRLQDSKFFAEDKSMPQKNTLFNDLDFTDKEYHALYPTIYHLRASLIKNKTPHDVRLVYLAIHHILKHRGHFLYEGQSFEAINDFKNIVQNLSTILYDHGIEFEILDEEAFEKTLKEKHLGIDKKKAIFKKALSSKTKIAELLAGAKVSLADLFENPSLKDAEINKISFSDGIDDKMDELRSILEDDILVIESLKALYDWGVLAQILGKYPNLSESKIAVYQEHKKDLEILKALLKNQNSKILRDAILNKEGEDKNYSAYIKEFHSCTQEDFCKFLESKLKDVPLDPIQEEWMEKVKLKKAFPKQSTKDNGTIPYQIHQRELKEILQNAQSYLPFLAEVDETGLKVTDKILSILTFRVPYYIGPLNPNSQFAWIEKKSDQKIYPWNFDQIVDKEKSAEGFILRMTNFCTYLPTQKVLPQQSILYSRFNILNQLNNLRINGERISAEIKQNIFINLFENNEKAKKITIKNIENYLKTQGYGDSETPLELTGVEIMVQGNMKSLNDFKKIFPEGLPSEEIIDNIISDITVFGESKDLLKNKLKKAYPDFSDVQIKGLLKLKYTGWGKLSRAFLCDIREDKNMPEESTNIITKMYETNLNLSEVLSNQYGYIEAIKTYNLAMESKEELSIVSEILKDLVVSPAIKRSVWRVLSIIKEIVKIQGKAPSKIFVEVARGGGNKGERTISRKKQLLELYKSCQKEEPILYEMLNNTDENKLKSKQLYLYYMQMGRCIYTGEKIELKELSTLYNIDHIYPRSQKKDDSILNNLVLTKEIKNKEKADIYPLPLGLASEKAKSHWKVLLKKEFISKEKYHRLTRKEGFSDNERSGFIARQLVETRQSTKAVIQLLEQIYKETRIIYVKAGNVSDFRNKYNLEKVRLVNSLHHAKDAYLNIVVGNVYDTKFTANPYNFIKRKEVYSLNKVFEYDVKQGNRLVWNSDKSKSLNKVKKQMDKNNCQFTRYQEVRQGELYNQNIVKAGKGQIPIKGNDARFAQMEKYGAYNKPQNAYIFLVEHSVKKQKTRTLECLPILALNQIKNENDLKNYAQNTMGLKDVKVIIPKIRYDSLVRVDGFDLHLSGKTGAYFAVKPAMPLILPKDKMEYAEKLENYIERNKRDGTVYKIQSYHTLAYQANIEFYHTLINKLKNTIYSKMPTNPIKIIENGQNKFENLEVEQQCQVLYNILTLFRTASSNGINLESIGGGKNSGKMSISSNIMKKESFELIHQSVTGLYEKIDNLKEKK